MSVDTDILALSGLVGFWGFSETSGTVADNAEGTSAKDGVYTNTPTLAQASLVPNTPSAGSVEVNGTNEYVAIADHDDWSLTTTGALTVGVWCRPISTAAGLHTIVGKGVGSGNQWEWVLYRNGTGPTFGTLLFQANGTPRESDAGPPVGSYPDDADYFLVMTMDDNVVGDAMILYVNGIAGTTATGFTGSSINGTSPLNFGRRPNNDQYFSGRFQKGFILNRVMTPTEVADIYASGQTVPGVTGTAASTVAPSTASTGTPIVAGTAAVSVAPQTSASGTSTVTGTAASTVAPTTAASATSRVTGTSAATVAHSTAVSGTPVVTGTAASAVAPSTAVGGTPVVTGTAALTVTPSTALRGEAQPVTGTMAASVAPSTSASGTPVVTGAVSSSVAAVASASGSGIVTGTIATAIPMAMTAALGSAVASGTMATGVVPSTSLTGAPVVAGSITASVAPRTALSGRAQVDIEGAVATLASTTMPMAVLTAAAHPRATLSSAPMPHVTEVS